jgi:hypothetical protein
MKQLGLSLALALALGLTLGLLWALGATSAPAVAAQNEGEVLLPTERHVCPSGCQFWSVQAAVDSANKDDIIKVAAGTYSDVHMRSRWDIIATGKVTQVVFLRRTLTIEGGYTPDDWTTPDYEKNPTILDAGGQGRVIYMAGDPDDMISPVIRGLTLMGGDATGFGGNPDSDSDAGGGVFIYQGSPRIERCRIYSNTAHSGGGVWLNVSGGASLVDNTIVENTAVEGGGMMAVYAFDLTLGGNVIASNQASRGGGLDLKLVHGTLTGNRIVANTAEDGGGLTVQSDSGIKMVNNVIADNQLITEVGRGSALLLEGSTADLVHTTIARNPGGDGGGVYVASDPGEAASIAMTNTVLVSQSVGIRAAGNCTVTVNSILWHNTPITVSTDATATVVLENQVTGDPVFEPDGYHLTANSAARDRGVDAGVAVDIDGERRPAGEGYDLGADEFSYRIFAPLVFRSG